MPSTLHHKPAYGDEFYESSEASLDSQVMLIESSLKLQLEEPLDEEQIVENQDSYIPFSQLQEREDDAVATTPYQQRVIANREDEYHSRRRLRTLSPERKDPFLKVDMGDQARGYADILAEGSLIKDQSQLVRKLRSSFREREKNISSLAEEEIPRRTMEWEMASSAFISEGKGPTQPLSSDWEEELPHHGKLATPSAVSGEFTPLSTSSSVSRQTRWDATPALSEGLASTPVRGPPVEWTIRGPQSAAEETPLRTPLTPSIGSTDSGIQIASRNAPLSDDELDLLLPSVGYAIVDPPITYLSKKKKTTLASGIPPAELGLFSPSIISPSSGLIDEDVQGGRGLPALKPEDYQHFAPLLSTTVNDEESLSFFEIRELKLLRLLLKLKNGTPQMRKVAQRQIIERAKEFGPAMLFDKILPLLMSPSLEDQERHLLVKLIDRILFRLEEQVRPFVHKILVVVEPLLIDEERATRAEGRELIANLAKAAGLATMLGAIRPDIDHPDEYVRNCTSRALGVVALALGIPMMIPFLSAVTASKKAGWEARHTGIRTVQHIATLAGCGVLPHLHALVKCAAIGLTDEEEAFSDNQNYKNTEQVTTSGAGMHKLRIASAVALAALAEASAPHGIEAFESVLRPLWQTIRQARGRALGAMLKAIGAIIPLMSEDYAAYYAREVIPILVREMSTPEDDLRRTVLQTLRQLIQLEGLGVSVISSKLLDPFFKYCWSRRLAADSRTALLVVDCALAFSHRIGYGTISPIILSSLKDDSISFRKIALDLLERMVIQQGPGAVFQAAGGHTEPSRGVALVIDALIFSLQRECEEDESSLGERPSPVSRAMGKILGACGDLLRPHCAELGSMLLWRLNNKNSRIRQQAADVISECAPIWVTCYEDAALQRLSIVLYEYLGEEFPTVLGSIIRALFSIVQALGCSRMQPPIKDLLPRLTPILKNRHEKVQFHCIELTGFIASKAAEAVSPREWMRICWELLETLHAHRRSIRRAAILSFGHIAKAIGPQDVLSTLLANLRVQERQSRVCTTIAIAIVAEVCAPFTVLPALMAEYRVPELNVQNGVLKSISFLFEYVGEVGIDYLYSIVPLLVDALMDRDNVHRQTAASAVRHVALGCAGLGCEDALIHLLNYVWPNIFEQSPHVITAIMDALEGLTVALGPGILFLYLIQGLFHPARRVRQACWRVYNMLLVRGQEALVPFYPDSGEVLDSSKYGRHYLQLVF